MSDRHFAIGKTDLNAVHAATCDDAAYLAFSMWQHGPPEPDMIEAPNILLIERIAKARGMRLIWQATDERVTLRTVVERFIQPQFVGTGDGICVQAESAAAAAVAAWAHRSADGLVSEW